MSSVKMPEFLDDQIFAGPFCMMLEYKQMKLDDPQLEKWIGDKLRRWKERPKPLTRYDQRVLKHKNKKPQKSTRIIRSVAKKLKMTGEPLESTRGREFLLFVYDYLLEINTYFLVKAGIRAGNEEKAFECYVRPALHYFLPIIRSSLNYYKSGYILKSGLSYIDFVIAEQLQRIHQHDPIILIDGFPELLEYKRRIYKALAEKKQTTN